ncbi:MAG TPA: PEP-CTERM sorting domain-containing protein [Gemmatales bacterium]|nr:PEP-CTERM sorting domain-containing protein [Gemmatales bacterium]
MTIRRGGWAAALMALAGALFVGTAPAYAQTGFSPGNIVVWRVNGDANYNPGGSALTNAATAIFLDQFNPNTAGQTAPTFTVSLPTVVGTLAQNDSGTATSNGFFTRSQNSTQLITPGYDAALGTASVAGSNPATITRSIGAVNEQGLVNSSTGFNNGPSNNFRSAAGDGLGNLWASTAGSATTAGIFHIPSADFGTVGAAVAVANGNWRNIRIFNNSLFGTSGSASPGQGLHLVGSVGTLPTGPESTTFVPGTGTSGSGAPSPYGFWFFDNPLNGANWNGTGFDTLYVADDRSVANGGGLQRWVYDGVNWNISDTITLVDGTSATGAFRGLAASIDTTGQPIVQLWLTTVASGNGSNQLVTITDTLSAGGGTFGSFVSLATSPENTVFRGVDFTPVPEPTTLAMLGMVGIGAGWYRWQRGGKRRSG